MSTRALPIQFLNLGGEMMYVIDQRLRAQSIPIERAEKVRNDILSIMLNKRFVDEIFIPQRPYSKVALRTVFDKLAHASIMRLNAASMDKLFDLMVMAMKHQLLLAPQPQDLVYVTLNHLDAMEKFSSTTEVKDLVHAATDAFLQNYCNVSDGEWSDIRRCLLIFVQDLNIRVSIFLKTGIQDHMGKLVIPIGGPVPTGSEVPGTIRFFGANEEISFVTRFPNGGSYSPPSTAPSLGPNQTRGTNLGLNVYNEKLEDCLGEHSSEHGQQLVQGAETKMTCDASAKGSKELNLLAELIGVIGPQKENQQRRINLFFSDEEQLNDADAVDESDESSSKDVITIEGRFRQKNEELGRIMGELDIDIPNEQLEDDLLDLINES